MEENLFNSPPPAAPPEANPEAPPEANPSEPPPEAAPGQDQASAEAGSTRVEGRDPQTVRLKREYEAEVESKVASDYTHIIWAYGIIWALFAIYGVILWRRAAAQRADLEALTAKLGKP